MSEKQKKMATRIIEILDEMGFIQKTNEKGCMTLAVSRHSIPTLDEWKGFKEAKEKLIRTFTEAIAMYQSEELEKEMQKFYEADRKATE